MRSYRLKNTVLASLLVLTGIWSASPGYAQVERSDATIAEAVGAELRHNDLVSYERLRLTVEDGIVSLTGSVPSITASREIDDVTATVRGVRAIVNRLDIDTPSMSAAKLRSGVTAALRDNAATDLYQIDVETDNEGTVIVSGTVDSWAEYDLAQTVVGTVSGVRRIDNRIMVDSAGYIRGAGEIKADILERLHWDARVDDSLISVLVRDAGRVTLSGTVGSLAEKRLAVSLAQVSGARSIDADHLEVQPWARDEDRWLGATESVDDNEVRAAINQALSLDPRVAAGEIDVTVVNGEVWLRGNADTLAASRAADRVAVNTRGARRVHNFLTVSSPVTDDTAIESQINRAFATIDGLDELGLIVSVDRGRAHIAGDVNSTEQYRRIDEILTNTRGIDSIRNNLTIQGELPRTNIRSVMPQTSVLLPGYLSDGDGSGLTDRALHEAVESELFWSPFVDESDIEIHVDEGEVTLTGAVRSVSESMAATDNAYEAGARTVNNALEVE